MQLGYILAIIFAAIWLCFKLLEIFRNNKAKNAKKVVRTEKTANTDINDLML